MARSYERSPLKRGGSSCFSDTPTGKASGAGYVKGMGIDSRGFEVLILRRRFLLQERGTYPGTLEYNFGHIRI